jgi:hypothetical protein
MLNEAEVAVCSEININHINTVWADTLLWYSYLHHSLTLGRLRNGGAEGSKMRKIKHKSIVPFSSLDMHCLIQISLISVTTLNVMVQA